MGFKGDFLEFSHLVYQVEVKAVPQTDHRVESIRKVTSHSRRRSVFIAKLFDLLLGFVKHF